MMAGVEYGNTRLRAQRSRLLDGDDYGRLTAVGTLDRMLGTLATTDYAPDVAAALPRQRGLRRLDTAVGRHLARSLRAMHGYYDSPTRDLVGLLLSRWDLQNLLAVVRGRAAHRNPEEITAATVPAGRIDAAQLAELARRPNLRETIDLMMAWGVPSPGTARRLLAAWPDYERSGDPVVLEHALIGSFGEHLDEMLGAATGGLATVLRAEVDEANLLTAVRLRMARRTGEDLDVATATWFSPGGRIRSPLLETLVWEDDPVVLMDALERAPLLPGWLEALRISLEGPARLADEFEMATTRHAVGLFARGDPLSTDVPVAFTKAKEHEARNLRWIGRGLVHGFAPAEIDARVEVIT